MSVQSVNQLSGFNVNDSKELEKTEKNIAKAERKGLNISQVTDTVSISKEGTVLSGTETSGLSINNIGKLELSQDRHEGKVKGNRRRKHGKGEISTSMKSLVEEEDQGKKVSKTPLERSLELKNQSENVNKKPLGLESPYKNFIGFMNSNDENGLLGQGSVSINLFA